MSGVMGHVVSTSLLLLGLGLVVLLLLLVRRAPLSGPSAMKLLARLPLDHRRALYMVRIGDKVLVLGASEGGMSRIAELGADEVDLPVPDAGWRSMMPRNWLPARIDLGEAPRTDEERRP